VARAGEHDHRDVGHSGVLQGLLSRAEAEAVHDRHLEIEHDQIGHVIDQLLERLLAVLGDDHRITARIEEVDEHRPRRRIIVHDEQQPVRG